MSKKNKHILAQAFPVAYVANGLNATRAYKEIKKGAKDSTARTEGSALLAKPDIRARIMALLPSEKIEARVIKQALTGDIQHEINWTERHKYLETSLKLKGLLNNTQQQGNTNIGIIIER